ncbi:MAG: hypothetical protein WD929_03420 [Steroidobacteraceae bacterium]
MSARQALCSWSGGKDSCLALHLAVEEGLEITTLLTVLEEDADRSRSHALPEALLRAQAEAMGMTLVTPRANWARYERVFIETLISERARGVEHAVFGDIDLVPHREWEEKVCDVAGLTAQLPLWLWPRSRVVDEIFRRDIEAVCVCVNTRFLPQSFCGRRYDRQFVADLPPGVDACGENGEFHTFVTNAPRYHAAVAVVVTGLREYQAPVEYGGDVFWFAELGRAP